MNAKERRAKERFSVVGPCVLFFSLAWIAGLWLVWCLPPSPLDTKLNNPSLYFGGDRPPYIGSISQAFLRFLI
jgi:hypothetical protein